MLVFMFVAQLQAYPSFSSFDCCVLTIYHLCRKQAPQAGWSC